MASREFEELLAAHFDGSLDEAGATKLEALLASDEGARNRFAQLARLEGLLRARSVSGGTEARLTSRVVATLRRAGSRRKFVGGVMQDLPAGRRPRRVPRLIAAAALLLAALGGAWLLMPPERAGTVRSATNSSMVGIRVSYGEKLSTATEESLQVRLTDGSRLDLAPESDAEVAQPRMIRLRTGKLRLKCRADRSHPFSVLAHGTEARAVGTEFTVEAKEKDRMKPQIAVSILTGVVLVTNRWGHLEAGEGKTVVSAAGKAPALLAEKEPPDKQDEKPAPRATAGLDKIVSLEFTATPLKDSVNYITEVSGRTITCDDELAKTPVALRLTKVPAVVAIRWLARLSKAKAYELPDKTIIITRTRPKNGTELLYEADESEEWKKEIEKKLKKKIDFEFVETPVLEAINFLQQLSGVNMVVDPAVRNKNTPITLKLRQMPLRLAMSWILKMAGCTSEPVDHALFITLGRNAPKEASGAKRPASGVITDDSLRKALSKRITVNFRNTPLKECLQQIKTLSSMHITAGKADPRTPITLKARDAAVKTVLGKVARQADLRIVVTRQNTVLLVPKTSEKPSTKPGKKAPQEVF